MACHVSLSSGLPREVTDAEINKWKQELSETLTSEQLTQLDGILSKFKKGSSSNDHLEGMVNMRRMHKLKVNFKYILL